MAIQRSSCIRACVFNAVQNAMNVLIAAPAVFLAAQHKAVFGYDVDVDRYRSLCLQNTC